MPEGIRGMKILKAAKIAPLMLHDKGFENWCDVICDVMTPFVTSRRHLWCHEPWFFWRWFTGLSSISAIIVRCDLTVIMVCTGMDWSGMVDLSSTGEMKAKMGNQSLSCAPPTTEKSSSNLKFCKIFWQTTTVQTSIWEKQNSSSWQKSFTNFCKNHVTVKGSVSRIKLI